MRHRIAIVAAVPADLLDAVSAQHDCVAHRAADGPLAEVRIALTTSMTGADAAVMDSLPALALLLCQGVGIDRIDLATAHARGIIVANTPHVFTEDVAEFAIALTMAALRRTVAADAFVRSGRWASERMAPATRIAGRTMGIVGLGRIGRAVAIRAEALGMRVHGHGPAPKADVVWPYHPDLIGLAAAADVLMLCAPGNAAAPPPVDGAVLEALGPGGWLVNVARGSLVDEAALIAALAGGRIAGAALDVFANEPAPDPRLLDQPNLVVAPHYASITHEARAGVIALILRYIADWAVGVPVHDAARP